MLVACRLAGLSALETYYAGVRARGQFGRRGPFANSNCAGLGRALGRVSARLRAFRPGGPWRCGRFRRRSSVMPPGPARWP